MSDQIILDDLAGLSVLDQRFLEANPKYRYGLYYKDICLDAYVSLAMAKRELWMTSPYIVSRMEIVEKWRKRCRKMKRANRS